jgi:hypothetical protein
MPRDKVYYMRSNSSVKRYSLQPQDRRSSRFQRALFVGAVQAFSSHADLEWGEYARRAGTKRQQGQLQALLSKFLIPHSNGEALASEDFVLWMDRLSTWNTEFSINSIYHYGFIRNLRKTALFAACAFDLSEVVEVLLKTTPNAFEICTDSGM